MLERSPRPGSARRMRRFILNRRYLLRLRQSFLQDFGNDERELIDFKGRRQAYHKSSLVIYALLRAKNHKFNRHHIRNCAFCRNSLQVVSRPTGFDEGGGGMNEFYMERKRERRRRDRRRMLDRAFHLVVSWDDRPENKSDDSGLWERARRRADNMKMCGRRNRGWKYRRVFSANTRQERAHACRSRVELRELGLVEQRHLGSRVCKGLRWW